MTSRERMLAALAGNDHDRVPFSPYIGQGPRPEWRDVFFWMNQLQRAERMLELDLDPVIDIWLPDPQPHPDVTIKTWRDTSGRVPLLTKEYHTPAGVLRQTVREEEGWDSYRHIPWVPTTFGPELRNDLNMHLFDDYNVSRRAEPWVKGPEDLEKLRYIIRLPDEGHVLDEWRMDAERACEIAERYQIATVVRRTIVGDAYQWFCDIPSFLMMLFDAPDFVKEFFGIFQTLALAQTELALDAGADVFQRRGWYEIPTMFGPDMFREFLVPLIEEETRMVHQAGKIHSYLLPEGHGAYADILRDMQVDALQGIDPRMLHGGDLEYVFDACGANHAFWGGVNAEVTLASGDEDAIDAAVKQAIEVLDRNGRLILSAFLFPHLSEHSLRCMISSYKKYRNR